MSWTVELPDAPVVSHNSRGFWNERYATHRLWMENTMWMARTVRAPFPAAPVSVTLTCTQADRRIRDVDNTVSLALKGVLDGLVKAGLLPDDSWRHVRQVTGRLESDPTLATHRWVLEVEAA